jgi:flagellin-like protein
MEDKTMKMNKFRKDNEFGVSPVIAVILMVAITVVLAGVLYVWVSGFGEPPHTNQSVSANLQEYSGGWTVKIISVSGSSFNIKDAGFRMLDKSDIRLWEHDVSEANPTKFTKGASSIYAIPSNMGTGTVDNGTSTVTPSTPLENYENCAIAFIDQDDNNKVSAGDTIYIFKDNDNDGVEDITNGYFFELLYKGKMVVRKSL